MLNIVLLAVGIPLVLIAFLLPCALLSGKVVSWYDSIPEDVKVRYGLSSNVPASFGKMDLLWMAAMLLLLWPADAFYPYQLLVLSLVSGVCAFLFSSQVWFYYSIVRVPSGVPRGLMAFSRFCMVGFFVGGIGVILLGVFCLWAFVDKIWV